MVHKYLQFLHSLFKSEESKALLALAYITGILPIKKIKDDIMTMLSGGKVMVDPEPFQNDLSEIHSKDDALTALIHLGYLAYDAAMLSAYIPQRTLLPIKSLIFTATFIILRTRSNNFLKQVPSMEFYYYNRMNKTQQSAYHAITKLSVLWDRVSESVKALPRQ